MFVYRDEPADERTPCLCSQLQGKQGVRYTDQVLLLVAPHRSRCYFYDNGRDFCFTLEIDGENLPLLEQSVHSSTVTYKTVLNIQSILKYWPQKTVPVKLQIQMYNLVIWDEYFWVQMIWVRCKCEKYDNMQKIWHGSSIIIKSKVIIMDFYIFIFLIYIFFYLAIFNF